MLKVYVGWHTNSERSLICKCYPNLFERIWVIRYWGQQNQCYQKQKFLLHTSWKLKNLIFMRIITKWPFVLLPTIFALQNAASAENPYQFSAPYVSAFLGINQLSQVLSAIHLLIARKKLWLDRIFKISAFAPTFLMSSYPLGDNESWFPLLSEIWRIVYILKFRLCSVVLDEWLYTVFLCKSQILLKDQLLTIFKKRLI